MDPIGEPNGRVVPPGDRDLQEQMSNKERESQWGHVRDELQWATDLLDAVDAAAHWRSSSKCSELCTRMLMASLPESGESSSTTCETAAVDRCATRASPLHRIRAIYTVHSPPKPISERFCAIFASDWSRQWVHLLQDLASRSTMMMDKSNSRPLAVESVVTTTTSAF